MSAITDTPVSAEPFTARQCPVCEVWVYCENGPFAEHDRTKTAAEFLHYEMLHMTPEERAGTMLGIPYFSFNTVPVAAVWEARAQEAGLWLPWD